MSRRRTPDESAAAALCCRRRPSADEATVHCFSRLIGMHSPWRSALWRGRRRGASMGSRHAWPARLHVPLRLLGAGLMRRLRMPVVTAVAVAGLGSVLLAGADPAVAGVPSAGAGCWDTAIEVPGTAALNTGGAAAILSVSCAAAGGCAAGGQYGALHHRFPAFVVTEAGGRWRKAIEVPGTAAVNTGGDAAIESVSCTAAGSCAAGGFYLDGSGHEQAFVVTEAGGRWRTAIEVPGIAALNTDGQAGIVSVSCAAAGSCAAGGSYRDGSIHDQAFVVSEANGRWGTAIEVPGT